MKAMPGKEFEAQMVENDSLSEEANVEAKNPEAAEVIPSEAPPLKDRRAGLIAFGVVQLLMALGLLAMAAFQFFMVVGAERFVPPGSAPASKGMFLAGGIFYLALAIVAAVLGIGSMRCRRWARALNLMLASLGLAMGVLVSIMLGFFMPGLVRTMESQMGGAQPGVGFVMGCMVVGMAFMYLITPGAFVVFYRSRHVKATCEFRDPKPRWTDGCPLPVLAGSVLLLSGSAAVLTPAMGLGIPLFGRVVTGAGSWLVATALGVVAVALAWGLYRMQRWAWLGALTLTALNGLNMLITFRGDGLFELYEQMGMPADQLETMAEMGITRLMTPMMATTVLLMFGFYLWLGRYFGAGET